MKPSPDLGVVRCRINWGGGGGGHGACMVKVRKF